MAAPATTTPLVSSSNSSSSSSSSSSSNSSCSSSGSGSQQHRFRAAPTASAADEQAEKYYQQSSTGCTNTNHQAGANASSMRYSATTWRELRQQQRNASNSSSKCSATACSNSNSNRPRNGSSRKQKQRRLKAWRLRNRSWLLAALLIKSATRKWLSYGLYFIILVVVEDGELRETEQREIDAAANIRKNGALWALLPGLRTRWKGWNSCGGNTEIALSNGSGARRISPKCVARYCFRRSPLMIHQPSRKEAVAGAGRSLWAAMLQLTDDAKKALATVGRFGKNFLPLLFNVHQAEPAEKRPALHEAVSAVASVTPEATFRIYSRRLCAAARAERRWWRGCRDDAREQRGLLDLLIALSPSLSASHLGCRAPSGPLLLSADVLIQKKAYKVLHAVGSHHPPAGLSTRWRRCSLLWSGLCRHARLAARASGSHACRPSHRSAAGVAQRGPSFAIRRGRPRNQGDECQDARRRLRVPRRPRSRLREARRWAGEAAQLRAARSVIMWSLVVLPATRRT